MRSKHERRTKKASQIRHCGGVFFDQDENSGPSADNLVDMTETLSPRSKRQQRMHQKEMAKKSLREPSYTVDEDENGEDDLEPKVDMTQSLPLRSKRTQRQNKKVAKRPKPTGFLDLPYDLLMPILCLLEPDDIITMLRVCKPIRDFIISEEKRIAREVIRLRYDCLSQCFRRPVLMRDIDSGYYQCLLSPNRPENAFKAHERTFQHIQDADASVVCTCLTCVQRWNSLCIVLDFAHWQHHLDNGKPIPIVPRGKSAEWNQKLLQSNAKFVLLSLESDLIYARILQKHLSSIIESIRRHSQNKGNKRKRFRMTDDDVQRGTSDFLERGGPPTIDFPHNRDNYYMLEAFLPNRSWITERKAWVYLPENQHQKDLEIAVMWEEWAARRREKRHLLGYDYL